MCCVLQVCHQVEEFNSARIRLAADMADDSQRVKALIVRAEDSRLMVDMESTRRAYTELYALNNQLIGDLVTSLLLYHTHTQTAYPVNNSDLHPTSQLLPSTVLLFSLLLLCIGGYNVRAANHTGLLVALKEVNQMIQRAANLRVGKPKQNVIADCRAAVKTNNMPALTRIIRYGYENGMSGSSMGTTR